MKEGKLVWVDIVDLNKLPQIIREGNVNWAEDAQPKYVLESRLPARAARAVEDVYAIGAKKHGELGDAWPNGGQSRVYFQRKLLRHLNAYLQGSLRDADDGFQHLAAVVFHALALLEMDLTPGNCDMTPRGHIEFYTEFGKVDFSDKRLDEEPVKKDDSR